MNILQNIMLLMITMVILSACNSNNSITSPFRECPNEAVEWVDVLMINDVRYQHHFPEPANEGVTPSIEKGKEMGKVSYMMSESA